MRNFTRLVLVSVLLTLLAIPMIAQDVGPGEGDPVIYPNLGDDPTTINPIVSSDGPSNLIIQRIYPDFIGRDPDTAAYTRGIPNGLALDWTISEDGLTYTFTLKDSYTWTDGTPVTAADIVYSFDAINTIATPLSYVLDDVASVVAVDDYTVEVEVNAPSCAAMLNIAAIPVVPAHQFREWFPTFEDMIDSEFNEMTNTDVFTASRFTYANFRPGEQTTLLADQSYPEPVLDGVMPEGFIYKNIADQTLIIEAFLADEITYLQSAPADRKDEMRELAEQGLFQIWEAPAITVRFIAMNEADPFDPQPAFDEDGNAVDQGFHPVLGDVRVRQALMHATDWESLNLAAFNGEGVQLASHWLPTWWVYDEEAVPFYDFDLVRADELLTEAGWTDADGDGVRECNGCLYAEEGEPFAASLTTNAGNTENENIGLVLADQWGDVGLDLEFTPIEFGTLVEELQGQTFDMVLLFWSMAQPNDPAADLPPTFDPANDLPGSGFNTTSFNNERYNELMAIANDPSQTDGCDPEVRKEMYLEVFQILRDEVPWFWVSTSIVVSGAQPYVEGFDPRPGSTLWNLDSWTISPESR